MTKAPNSNADHGDVLYTRQLAATARFLGPETEKRWAQALTDKMNFGGVQADLALSLMKDHGYGPSQALVSAGIHVVEPAPVPEPNLAPDHEPNPAPAPPEQDRPLSSAFANAPQPPPPGMRYQTHAPTSAILKFLEDIGGAFAQHADDSVVAVFTLLSETGVTTHTMAPADPIYSMAALGALEVSIEDIKRSCMAVGFNPAPAPEPPKPDATAELTLPQMIDMLKDLASVGETLQMMQRVALEQSAKAPVKNDDTTDREV